MLKRVASIARRFGVPMPAKFGQRVDNYVTWKLSQNLLRDIFAKCITTSVSPGLWRVEPMPSEDVLRDYYQLSYWPTRQDQDRKLRDRDVGQFLHLRDFLSQTRPDSPKRALNFGSGHGGISYLLLANGFEVTNLDVVDPNIPTCNFVSTLESIQHPLDLIYSSHSLEHVRDVPYVLSVFCQLLRPGGLIYVEVPNSSRFLNREREALTNALHPPHTFYFIPDYFRSLSLGVLDVDTHRYSGNPYGEATNTDQAEVIRAILQKSV